MTTGIFECSIIMGQMWAINFSDGSIEDWEPFQNSVRVMGPLPARIATGHNVTLNDLMAAVVEACQTEIPGINIDVGRGARFKFTDANDTRAGTPYFALEVSYSAQAYEAWQSAASS